MNPHDVVTTLESKALAKLTDRATDKRLRTIAREFPDSVARRKAAADLEDLKAEHIRWVERAITDREILKKAREVMVKRFGKALLIGHDIAGIEMEPTDLEVLSIASLAETEAEYLENFAKAVEVLQVEAMGNKYRASLYGGAVGAAFYRGWLAALPDTAKIFWRLGIAEHCFEAGTPIRTPSGDVPIETLRVGDVVSTLQGPKKVTRLFRSNTHRVISVAGLKVTPNHPFLTQRGWVEAGSLRRGDEIAVLDQNGHDVLFRQVTFPNANNSEATLGEVLVTRHVSSLLPLLAMIEMNESRVSVPPVPVHFDDEFSNADVHDKVFLDDRAGFERDANGGQHRTQSHLRLAWPCSITRLLGKHRKASLLLRMSLPELANLLNRVGVVHGIGRSHALSGRLTDPHCDLRRAETNLKFVRTIANLLWSLQELSGQAIRSVGWISQGNGLINMLWPRWHASPTNAGLLAVFPDQPAPGASGFRRDLLARDVTVATTHAAEALELRHGRRAVGHEWRGTPLANKGLVEVGGRHETIVYNIEVEGAHHYLAGGCVVHNCNSCLEIAASNPWSKPGAGFHPLWTVPGNGDTQCRTNCQCFLEAVVGGRITRLSASAGFEVTRIGSTTVNPSNGLGLAASRLYDQRAALLTWYERMAVLDDVNAERWDRLAGDMIKSIDLSARIARHTIRRTMTTREVLDPVDDARAHGYRIALPTDDLVGLIVAIIETDNAAGGRVKSMTQAPFAVTLENGETYRMDAVGRDIILVPK